MGNRARDGLGSAQIWVTRDAGMCPDDPERPFADLRDQHRQHRVMRFGIDDTVRSGIRRQQVGQIAMFGLRTRRQQPCKFAHRGKRRGFM